MTRTTTKQIALWAGRVLLAFVFLMTGGHKLAADPMMVAMFGKIGLGQGFRYVTGIIEIAVALLVLWPRTSFYAACAMVCVMIGAFCTQAFILHGDVIHTIVLAIATASLAWFQRPRNAGAMADA